MTGYRPAQVIEAIGRHLRAYEKDRTIGTRKGIRFFTGSLAKKISRQTDAEKQKGYVALIKMTKEVLETCINLLGFKAPERM